MANQYVQYGAAVGLGLAATGAVKGIGVLSSAGSAGYNSIVGAAAGAAGPVPIYGGISGAADAISGAAGGAASAAAGAITNTLASPAFLTSVGLGIAGMLLGSGAKRPSLNIPNVAAALAVGLNVGNLIQQGKAAAASFANAKAGLDITSSIGSGLALNRSSAAITRQAINQERQKGKTQRNVFPPDLSDQYYIRFALYDYSRMTVGDNKKFTDSPHTTIRLPIPSNLIDAINLAYADVNMGQFGGAVYESFVGGGTSSDFKNRSWSENAGQGMDSILKAFEDSGFQQALMRRAASSMDPGIGTAFDLATGTAPNPHVAVAFTGVALKRYQFSWKFSPNNVEESKHLHEIIRTIQSSSLPTKQGNFMLGFPNVVNVEMSPNNLFIFKKMMIDNVAVNYAPNGVPSFFANKSGPTEDSTNFGGQAYLNERYPTEIQLSISLREIDIHTANDADWSKHGVGYADSTTG